jgi:hypothetical protein
MLKKLCFCLLLSLTTYGQIAMATEEPPYTAILTEGSFEIREYPSLIAAEVTVTGERSEAVNAGFRLLAGYIFGGNTTRQSIAMTSPVTQTPKASEKIAMTAPVIMKMGDSASMSFVMPSEYSLKDLPSPSNNQVKLVSEGSKVLAVVRFGGFSNSEKIKQHADQLYSVLDSNGLKHRGELLYLGYNAPWDVTNRRNEVAVELVDFK